MLCCSAALKLCNPKFCSLFFSSIFFLFAKKRTEFFLSFVKNYLHPWSWTQAKCSKCQMLL